MPADLYQRLCNLDGKSYGAYKSLRGSHRLPDVDATLIIDRVQSDPFAPPSKVRIRIPLDALDFRGSSLSNPGHFATAELDLLNRRLAGAFKNFGRGLFIDTPVQQVLRRRAVAEIDGEAGRLLQICAEIQLPARGRRILGREAARLVCDDLVDALYDAVFDAPVAALTSAAQLEHDQRVLRTAVAEAGLVGFIADGSILPRRAGNSQLPKSDAKPFAAPDSLSHTFELPSGKAIRGMGIPQGVTLIVGGGYHGKSTLLSALITGVYDHVAGDGREYVVSDSTAVALRAEDGRAITGTNISPFINGLPSGDETSAFVTTNASGSTSQAAGLVEALAADCKVLLIDEDTSATNFMIRDERMRRLIPDDREPITPLVARVRELWENHGISTVIVAGGSGAFIDVADTVIAMDSYVPHDVTERAHSLRASEYIAVAAPPSNGFSQLHHRFLTTDWPAGKGRGVRSHGGRDRRGGGRRDSGHSRGLPKPPRARGREVIQIDKDNLDLRSLSQIMDSSQTETIARILAEVIADLDGKTELSEVIRQHYTAACNSLFDADTGLPNSGRLAEPRIQDVAAAINRLRLLHLAR